MDRQRLDRPVSGSAGTEFVVDPITGEVTAMNKANGAESTNNTTANNTTNNTTTQTNNAVVNNTLDLSANTGGNKSSFNTGGSSDIVTGDAQIIANLVNFVNNNITGGGKLVVTVINVFGSWLGDFVAPGQTQQARNNSGGESNNTNATNTSNNSGSNSTSTVAGATGNKVIATVGAGSSTYASSNGNSNLVGGIQGSSDNSGTNTPDATVAKSVGQDGSAAVANKKLNINLAWFLLGFPLIGMALIAKKSFVPVQKLAMRGIHFFL